MNPLERHLQQAISAARASIRQTEQMLNPSTSTLLDSSNPVEAASVALGGRKQTIQQPVEPQSNPAPAQEAAPDWKELSTPRTGGFEPIQEPPRTIGSSSTKTHPPLTRPGFLFGVWSNPYIAAAMPLLLLIERYRDKEDKQTDEVRAQVVRELQYFQQKLLTQNGHPSDVEKLSYLLCTHIDSILSGFQKVNAASPSLLVEFHRDAWGGEECFEHLKEYLSNPQQNVQILGMYDLILSLGFEGKYKIIERGSVLLNDLRNRLNTLLYGQNPTQRLSLAEAAAVAVRTRWISAGKILCFGLVACLLTYAASAWYLHTQSRQIRSDILAWEPPVPRRINIMETLPEPLPNILNEGWLEVRKDPRGWLLIFTSDGAFRTGEAELSAGFIQNRNIERLGNALAPWPGDLEVIGHTDNKPFRNSSANSNQKLSEARARVVAEKLQHTTGLLRTHQREIIAFGRGESEPLADNSTEEGRRRNRRVDILWKVGQRDIDPSTISFQPGRDGLEARPWSQEAP